MQAVTRNAQSRFSGLSLALATCAFVGASALVSLEANAGVRVYHGHKESGSTTTSKSITKLESDTQRRQQGHYQNSSAKWDTIHETIDTGLGQKVIETSIEAKSYSAGDMQEVTNEWLGFEEHSMTQAHETESQSYTGWD